MSTVEKMFTPKELAALLGCAQSRLSQWRKDGVGPRVTRMGFSGVKSKVRYMASDIAEWQASLPKTETNTRQKAPEEAERVA